MGMKTHKVYTVQCRCRGGKGTGRWDTQADGTTEEEETWNLHLQGIESDDMGIKTHKVYTAQAQASKVTTWA